MIARKVTVGKGLSSRGFFPDQKTRDKLKLNGKKAQGPKAQGSFDLYFGRTNAAHCPETL